jgi:hypothetical protein
LAVRYQARLALLADRMQEALQHLRAQDTANLEAEDFWIKYCCWRQYFEREEPRLAKVVEMELAAGTSKERVWASRNRHRMETDLLDYCALAISEFDLPEHEESDEIAKDLLAVVSLAKMDLKRFQSRFQSVEPYKSQFAKEAEELSESAIAAVDELDPIHAVRLQGALFWSFLGNPGPKMLRLGELLELAEANEAKARNKDNMRATLASPQQSSSVNEVAGWPPHLNVQLTSLNELRERVQFLEEMRQREDPEWAEDDPLDRTGGASQQLQQSQRSGS